MTLPQALQLAVQLYQRGELAQSENLCRQILNFAPQQPVALHLLGVLVGSTGRTAEALDLIRKAIKTSPNDPSFHNSLGNFLKDQKYLDEAEKAYRESLRLQPANPFALCNLGSILAQQGRDDAAIEALNESLRLKPDLAGAHSNLASIYVSQHRYDEADAAFQQALKLDPADARAWNNLGNLHRATGRTDDALADYNTAIEKNPSFAEAHFNLANLLNARQKLEAALAHYDKAIALKPNYADAYNNRANTLKDSGRLDDALADYATAVKLAPDDRKPLGNQIYVAMFHPNYTPQNLLNLFRNYNQRFIAPLKKLIQPHANDRSPDRKLRIGYVSPNFSNHCQSFFTIPLLSNHDHANFEIFAYSDVQVPDAVTEKIRPLCDRFIDTAAMSDDQLAAQIRNDQIDILVDLTMLMAGNRALLFARKPAPVQVAWLAYPGTTGMDTIDYRITDPHLDPPCQHDDRYTETSIRLPDSFWCYDPLASEPPVGELPFDTTGHFTFGCLNNYAKVHAQVLETWADILAKVPNSRLILLVPYGPQRDQAMQFFQSRNIDPGRIELLPFQPRHEYLDTYNRIDIGLDTFPCNGHTTSLDAYWMGVPVVTLVGPTVMGRAGLSQLTNLGLTDLITTTREEYVAAAVKLTEESWRLKGLRRTLRNKMELSALMDAPAFARNIESAFRQMWQNYCSTA